MYIRLYESYNIITLRVGDNGFPVIFFDKCIFKTYVEKLKTTSLVRCQTKVITHFNKLCLLLLEEESREKNRCSKNIHYWCRISYDGTSSQTSII